MCLVLCFALLLPTIASIHGQDLTGEINDPSIPMAFDIVNDREVPIFGNVSEPFSANFISIEEYFAKYDTATIMQGFAQSAHQSLQSHQDMFQDMFQDMLRDMSFETAEAAMLSEASSVAQMSLDGLMTGYFMGMTVLAVTDLPPYHPHFMFRLDNSSFVTPVVSVELPVEHQLEINSIAPMSNGMRVRNGVSSGIPYRKLYNIGGSRPHIEENAGAFFYKYSLGIEHSNHNISFDIFFNNTLVSFADNNNLYIYAAAQSNVTTIDFGLLGNRGIPINPGYGGLRIFVTSAAINNGQTVIIDDRNFDVLPNFVALPFTPQGGNDFRLNGTIHLSINVARNANGTNRQELFIGARQPNGNITYIFDLTYNIPTISPPGHGRPLAFLQAMTFVEADGNNTRLNSRAFVGPVTFRNAYLRNTVNGVNTPFYAGANTGVFYVYIQNPNNISYNNQIPGLPRQERVSIHYGWRPPGWTP